MNFPTVLKAALAASILGTPWAFGDGVADSQVIGVHEKQEEIGVSAYNKGLDYTLGRGVPKDEVEAVKWFLLSAKKGYKVAQHNLAQVYEYGIGIEINREEAFRWYKKAAEQGYAPAQRMMWSFYFFGRHPAPKDPTEGFRWLTLAANKGYAQAQCDLAACFQNGLGTQENQIEAVKWFLLAADQGHSAAQRELAIAYSDGRGVPKDDVEAYKWFNLTAAQGDAESARNRESLATRMTPEQIAEAQKLSREWKPKGAETDSANQQQ